MYKIALIGYGGIGQWHAKHVKDSGFASICGIYDIDPEKNELASSHGFPICGSLAELLQCGAASCIVATPNDTHAELTIACLQAGMHVLVEKPVACTPEGLKAMYDTAQQCGRVLAVHQNRRWDVDYLAMKRIIQEKRLGKILNIESRVHGSRGIPGGWRREVEKGGGMLFDWGVHLVDQMLLLYEGDEVESVQCRFTYHMGHPVDDGFHLTLHIRSGARGFVEVSTCNFIALPRFYMTCDRGTAVINDWRENGQAVQCLAWDESEVCIERRCAGTTKTMAPRDEKTVQAFVMDRPALEPYGFLRNFCDATEGKSPLLVTREQVERVFAVLCAAMHSAKNGAEPVLLEDKE